MKVVQVKGSNGSGKTTIAKQLIHLNSMLGNSEMHEAKFQEGGKTWVYATYLYEIGWALIGKYDPNSKMGGCDGIDTIDRIKQAIHTVVTTTPYMYGLMFEGMMISTIASTFYNYLLDLAAQPKLNIHPLFVILNATPEACIKRIEGRGTMKTDLNHDNIAHKCAGVVKHAQAYDQKYVCWMDVDKLQVDQMVSTFLSKVGDKDLIDTMDRECIYGEPRC